MEPGASLAVVVQVCGEFDTRAEFFGEFDVFFGQVMRKVWRCGRYSEKEGFVLVALSPCFEKFYAFVHGGKGLDIFFWLG